MHDISPHIDQSQYGNMKGSGTEHMIVSMMDKILQILDKNSNKSAVIASLVDWSSQRIRPSGSNTSHTEIYQTGCQAIPSANSCQLPD